MEWFFVIVIGLLVPLLIYLGHRAAQRRRERLTRLARQLGWEFDPDRDGGFHERYGHDLYRRGRQRVAYNTLRGVLEIKSRAYRVTMGDYRFTEGSGKHRTTHTLSYLLVRLPFAAVPALFVRGEWLGDRLLGALGFDDIDFESEQFSRSFYVKSADKRFAYAVIHPRMMEFLLARRPPRIELVDCVCLLWDGTHQWDIDEFRRRLGWARDFLELWPEHLMDRFETGGQTYGP